MISLRKFIRQNQFTQSLYYALGIDNWLVRCNSRSYMRILNNAIKEFRGRECVENQLIRDVKDSYFKYKISPYEYFLFNFPDKTYKERSTYLSDKLIYISMAKVVGRKLHDKELEDKFNFYKLTGKFFKRDVCCVNSTKDYHEFEKMAKKHKRLILKMNESACGYGINVVSFNTVEDIEGTFNNMIVSGAKWIVEELIKQVPEMAAWNESSVNTIRLSTFLNSSGFHLLCPFMRTGRRGAIVDNGGQGGIYCCIDPNTGIILTDGQDERNNKYITHPDSGIIYKGWQVPQWEELICLAEEVHKSMPKHKYVAWDFALSDKGWVLIEGNWGEFVAQQSTMGKGYKKQFLELING